MRKKILTIFFLGFFGFILSAAAQNLNELKFSDQSLQELKSNCSIIEYMSNNPDLIWIPDGIVPDGIIPDGITLDGIQPEASPLNLITKQDLKKILKDELTYLPDDKINDFITFFVETSDKLKGQMAALYANEIDRRTQQGEDDSSPETFISGVQRIKETRDVATEKILEVLLSGDNDGADATSQVSSGNTIAEENSDDFVSACPMYNPDEKLSSWAIYPDGKDSGNTYTRCGYYGSKGAHIKYEHSVLDGKNDATWLDWGQVSGSDIYYFKQRRNWSEGIKDGIQEEYHWDSASGNVYLAIVEQYSKGVRQSITKYWKNGNARSENLYMDGVESKSWSYFENGDIKRKITYASDGKQEKSWTYKEDGTLSKCIQRIGQTGKYEDCPE